MSGLPCAVDTSSNCPAGGDGWLAQLISSVASAPNAVIRRPLGLPGDLMTVRRAGMGLEIEGALIHRQRGFFGRLR